MLCIVLETKMNKRQELELVNHQINEIREHIQIFQVKLVDLENRKQQLENEIYITVSDEAEVLENNDSNDHPEVKSEWALEDPVFVMYADPKREPSETEEDMQVVRIETTRNHLDLGGSSEIEEPFETVQSENTNININQTNSNLASTSSNGNAQDPPNINDSQERLVENIILFTSFSTEDEQSSVATDQQEELVQFEQQDPNEEPTLFTNNNKHVCNQ